MNLFRLKREMPPLSRLRVAVKTSDTVTLRKVLAADPELLNYQDDKGATPLHWAAEGQDLSVVAALMDLGADASIKDSHGYTPRDIACWFGEFRMGAYTDTCLKIVQRLNEGNRNA
jgi:ankyrin repeat protein